MLTRMWVKRSTYSLLVGGRLGTTNMEMSMDVLQNTKIYNMIQLYDSLVYDKKTISYYKDAFLPLVIPALFMRARNGRSLNVNQLITR